MKKTHLPVIVIAFVFLIAFGYINFNPDIPGELVNRVPFLSNFSLVNPIPVQAPNVNGNNIIPVDGQGFYGMKIVSANQNQVLDRTTIITTGVRYVLTDDSLEMWRMIDPATNNTQNPRLVARLTAVNSWGPFTVSFSDSEKVVMGSAKADFTFMSDSLVLLKAKQDGLQYTHHNLVTNAPWNRHDVSRQDRMWTDGYGGSMHTEVTGSPLVDNYADDTTDIELDTGETMAHMAFPPKLFDLEGLYGANARPFVQFFYDDEHIQEWMANSGSELDQDAADGFGVIALFSELYNSPLGSELGGCNAIDWSDVCPQPPNGILGYEYRSPQLIHDFITLAHSKGFKIITYLYEPGDTNWWGTQTVNTTLEWMRGFQQNYDLDGWFFDGMIAGDFMQTYEFTKQVRRDIGDDGIIFHHSSWEALGPFQSRAVRTDGVQAVHINAYTNYQLAGETGSNIPGDIVEIHLITSPYLHYWSTGYGIAQNWGSHKLSSESDVSIDQVQTMMAYLNGVQRRGTVGNDYDAWNQGFKPTYDAIKQTYLNGTFVPYQYPINGGQPIYTTFNITATADSGGTISPTGFVIVPQDSSKTYTFTPNTGFYTNFYLDGSDVPLTGNSYTFNHIQANHIIDVKFKPIIPGGPGNGGSEPCTVNRSGNRSNGGLPQTSADLNPLDPNCAAQSTTPPPTIKKPKSVIAPETLAE